MAIAVLSRAGLAATRQQHGEQLRRVLRPPPGAEGRDKSGGLVPLADYAGWRVKRSRRHAKVADAVIVTLGGPAGCTAHFLLAAEVYRRSVMVDGKE